MSERDDFLAWVKGPLQDAERALHAGDPEPRRALWSRNEPVSVLGAWRNAVGLREVDELFGLLGEDFTECTSFEIEVLAADVVGDVAWTAGFEHTVAAVHGEPRTYTLRVTQVYRREDGGWKVAHRHGDTVVD
jgi:ketosteroid isomerase-like protein